MSNYSEVFHKCGDIFRDVNKLFFSDGSVSAVSGSNPLSIAKIWYEVYKSFSEATPQNFLLCGSGHVGRISGFIPAVIIIQPTLSNSILNDSSESFVSSNHLIARVVI